MNKKVSTLCGNGEPGHVDGPCNKAKLNFPQKIEIEVNQYGERIVYVTELNDCVRAIDLVKKEVYTICGGFSNKNGFKDGDGKTALMNFPYGIVMTEKGKFLITESDNHSIRILDIKSSIS